MVPYSGKLSRENWWKIWFLRRKLLWIAHSCCAKGHHTPKFLRRKLSRIATKPRNSQKFSPSKVSCYTVSPLYIPTKLAWCIMITSLDDIYIGCMWECFWLSFTSFCSCVTLVASSMDSLRVLLLALVILGFILLISSSLHSLHKKHTYNILRLVPLLYIT